MEKIKIKIKIKISNDKLLAKLQTPSSFKHTNLKLEVAFHWKTLPCILFCQFALYFQEITYAKNFVFPNSFLEAETKEILCFLNIETSELMDIHFDTVIF